MENRNKEEKLIELIFRILFDVRPSFKADAVYIFGQTSDSQKTLFEAASNLYKNKDVDKIVICGEDERTGYPGFRDWQVRLTSFDIGQSDIIGLKTNDGTINTLHESQALVKLAKEEKWKTIYIVTSPFHQIRAFITLVSVLKKSYSSFGVFNRPAGAMAWGEAVLHSQGILKASRAELIFHELKRIEEYHKKGDLVSYSEVLDYLNSRDSNINE